ncbi:S41 family peptidase [Floridanema evergladense]|uniref:S41 family peptidase n=1 Tax=Floridaenema evergladense BLCC-F167 TaxID=3153639 RepID=A0ABV4WGB7_9CYAN
MKRFRLIKKKNSALIILFSISILLLSWLISPVIPRMLATQSKTFNSVWETVNDNFYDPKFNGVDWKGIQSKYAPQISKTQTTDEAAIIINQMLGELNTSHTRFYTQNEPAYYQILGIFAPMNQELQKQLKNIFPSGKIEYSDIGIYTKKLNNKTFINTILDGSPAAKVGLKIGDEIINADGKPFHPIKSFAGKAGQKVTLKIQRKTNANSQQEITVTPKMFDTTTMFLDAQIASTQIIEREGKKIGYVHIWSYAGDQYQQQLEDDLIYGRLKDADALVLDLRDGWGGAPMVGLNIFLAQPGFSLTNINRNGRRSTYYSHWKKPVVMLVNEGSRSAKEIVAYGFQKAKIGSVIGTKTAGAVVAGRPFLLADGTLLYVAVANVYVDENQRLEGKGVTPDIVVPFPIEYAQGNDPQKERAITEALAKL